MIMVNGEEISHNDELVPNPTKTRESSLQDGNASNNTDKRHIGHEVQSEMITETIPDPTRLHPNIPRHQHIYDPDPDRMSDEVIDLRLKDRLVIWYNCTIRNESLEAFLEENMKITPWDKRTLV